MLSHFVFLEAERDLSTALTGQYDLLLVVMSVMVAILSTYTAFLVSERLRAADKCRQYLAWLSAGALALGGGVWAMHFIGMLAYKLPIAINYDVVTTIISVIPAILASIVILRINADKSITLAKLAWLSVLMGSGIGLMHYIGMSAMSMDGFMRYDPNIFLLSIVIAVALAGIAIRLKLWAENFITAGVIFSARLLIASIIMGCAITGMHYTGMAAMAIFPDTSTLVFAHTFSANTLTQMIVIVVLLTVVLMITAIEVSRRFDLYQQIKDSESRNRVILNNILGAVITINDKGIIKTVNNALETIFGYSADEVIGRNVKILVPEPDSSLHDSYLKNYTEGGEARIIGTTRTTEAQRKDGSIFPIELDVCEVEQHGERMFIGIVRDITERNQVEMELEKYRTQLEDLVQERTHKMKCALDEAERANLAKSDFLSHMSHELRTPLNAIIGFGQMLDMDSDQLNDIQQDNVKEILDAGHHLLNLINEVLDLAKIESGKLDVSMECVDLVDVLQQCLSLIQPHAEERQIKIIDNLSDKGYSIHADFTRVKQVLLNLLSNAVKYNCESGKITLDCDVLDETKLRIRVTDTGKGLTDNEISKLFNTFVRLDEVNNVEGTGIGLVISKHLMEIMGGSIGIESREGEGSTFWIEFLLVQPT